MPCAFMSRAGGSIGYCPQMAWIQNAAMRDNILFIQPFDQERYAAAIRDACLDADLEMLPNGDMAEIGEKGESLLVWIRDNF